MIKGLGERIKKLRISRKLSQRELAELLGVSVTLISNYENSERTPSAENIIALANIFRCSSEYLLGIEKNKNILDTSMLNDNQMKYLRSFLNELAK